MTKKILPKALGLPEYANNLFVVHDGAGSTSSCMLYDDPADAIAEAEELAKAEGATWYVGALHETDDPPVHIARPAKKWRCT